MKDGVGIVKIRGIFDVWGVTCVVMLSSFVNRSMNDVVRLCILRMDDPMRVGVHV
jgi:hypothetical protein